MEKIYFWLHYHSLKFLVRCYFRLSVPFPFGKIFLSESFVSRLSMFHILFHYYYYYYYDTVDNALVVIQ